MGASNSTPQVVPIMNPNIDATIIEMTPEVALRIAEAKKQYILDGSGLTQHDALSETSNLIETSNSKCRCGKNSVTSPCEPSVQDALLYKTAVEMQEEEFQNTVANLERMFGKPLEWTEESKTKINSLRDEVLSCYKEYTREPLRCNHLAEEFQSYVFKQQFANMLAQREEKERQQAERDAENNADCPAAADTYPKSRAGTCGGRNSADDTHRDTGIKVGGDCKQPSDLEEVQHDWQQNNQNHETQNE